MKYQPKKIKIVPKEISELTTQGKKYTSLVMVNVRECGLDYMFHKHHIKDYQHKAGIRFRQIFENSAIGGMKGRDFSAIIVTASKDKVSYGALGNISELVEIHKKLGDTGYNIACYICGEDYSLFNPDAANMRADCGSPSDPDLERKNGAITYIWLW